MSDLLPHLFVCPSSITSASSTPKEKAHGKNSGASGSSTRPLPVSVVVGSASLPQPPIPDADASPWCAGAGLCLFDDSGWQGWFRVGCATKHEDGMEERSTISTPMASTREAMNRWAVAPGGGSPGVKELALKGPLRCDAGHQDGRAWLRGRMVSPPEADGNRREKTPLPQHPARWGSERTRKDSPPGRVATTENSQCHG